MSEKQEMTAELLAKKSIALFSSIIDINKIIGNVYITLYDAEALIEMSEETEQMIFNKYKDMLVEFRDNLWEVRTNLQELEEKCLVRLKE